MPYRTKSRRVPVHRQVVGKPGRSFKEDYYAYDEAQEDEKPQVGFFHPLVLLVYGDEEEKGQKICPPPARLEGKQNSQKKQQGLLFNPS